MKGNPGDDGDDGEDADIHPVLDLLMNLYTNAIAANQSALAAVNALKNASRRYLRF